VLIRAIPGGALSINVIVSLVSEVENKYSDTRAVQSMPSQGDDTYYVAARTVLPTFSPTHLPFSYPVCLAAHFIHSDSGLCPELF
jgi:hypothetical protein